MKKNYLLTPGPTPIPEAVYSTFAKPLLHHRTPQFQVLFEDVRKGLQYVFQTKQDVLTLASSGTGAMDAAICTIFRKGEKIISVNGGKFGDRWGKIAKAYGMTCAEIMLERGDSATPKQIEDAVRANPDARAICFQASETSTGAVMPTKEITEIAHGAKMLSVCDAITACGVFDLPMDEWGIDVLITGSQKALMIPPGLSFVALSEAAWRAAESSDLPKFYFDLQKERKSQAKNQSAWTPATSLIQGLQVSLQMIREEGLHNIFKRHELLARATRAGVKALGLEILAKNPSPAVTAVRVPPQIKDGKLIPKTMRDKYGVVIAGGQDELEGKIFRLSHFGYAEKFDITTALSALELTLHDLGFAVELGKGVGAALRVFAET